MSSENEKIVVDFQKKQTEANWIQTLDAFGIRSAPIWFEWLEWVLVTAAFQYLFEKTKSLIVFPIICISVTFFVLYFNAFFFRIKFRGLPFLKRFENRRWPSIVLSGLLALISYELALHLATIIAKNTS